MPKARHAQALLIAILLIAFALRLAPWGHNRFLEDEALYAYWGLQIANGADPMLDEEPVDKPPLHPYLLALSFLLTSGLPDAEMIATQASGEGSGAPPPSPPRSAGGREKEAPLGAGWSTEGALLGLETAARLPSLFASMAGIALVYALGRQLYGDVRVGLIAALLLALAPFDILFASTAFTDPLMTALVLGALVAATNGRWGAAGLLAGLAFAAKQQAIFFLPLLVAAGWLVTSRQARTPQPPNPPERRAPAWIRRASRQPWLRFVLGFALVVAGIIWWDLSRLQRPGFFEQSLISYGGLAPAQISTLAQRAVEWLGLLGAFWVSPWFNLLLLAILGAWLLGGSLRPEIEAPSRVDLVLLVFVLTYLGLHWIIGFQVWDRYLLGLVPLLALLVGRALVALGSAIQARPWRRVYAIALGLILVLGLAGPLLQAARSNLPVGGDHGAYDGILDVAAYMHTDAPRGSVLYHYWLGYHYRFYLYGSPLRLHWYPDLEDLTHDATVYRREPRYMAFPSWRDGAPAVAALADAGIELVPVLETTRRDGDVSFRLYRLEGP